jgi:hypothetical protein
MEHWYQEDEFEYLFDVLLECPDQRARTYVAMFIKYVVIQLREKERDYLNEKEQYTTINLDGSEGKSIRFKALSTRFIMKAIMSLNYKAARNWNRFEQFLDVLKYFAIQNLDDIDTSIFDKKDYDDMEYLPSIYQ